MKNMENEHGTADSHGQRGIFAQEHEVWSFGILEMPELVVIEIAYYSADRIDIRLCSDGRWASVDIYKFVMSRKGVGEIVDRALGRGVHSQHSQCGEQRDESRFHRVV